VRERFPNLVVATRATLQSLDAWMELARELVRRPATIHHARNEIQRILDENDGAWTEVEPEEPTDAE
jgi:hypothetical protein